MFHVQYLIKIHAGKLSRIKSKHLQFVYCLSNEDKLPLANKLVNMDIGMANLSSLFPTLHLK